MDHGQKDQRKVHPWQRANLFSKLTFLYTRGLFWRTYVTNKLEDDDLYEVPACYKSQKLGDELEKKLELDLKNNVASIYRILWSCYGKEYLIIGLIQLLSRTIVVMTIPMTLSKLVLYFQPNQKEITKQEAYLYAVLLIGLNLMSIIYMHNYMLVVAALGVKVKTAFCSLMYRKSLKLTAMSLSEIPIGKIVTLMTKDVAAFEKIILYWNDIWIGFVQAAMVCYLIYEKMGVAAFAGVGFLLVVIPFQSKNFNLGIKQISSTYCNHSCLL
uniref:Multidrug resistance-associated protein 4 n=1 Tax=Anoplophora glabripennis TaxID=217634 RepID=V5GX36_ANOGL